ncbi:hypothetical protein EVAR_4145_1 [Eumeta japonica]|uniref:Uncharacterized protein n=1 Tax=Eumeta variegata TaxID=151549 RepID=A0A4C1TFU1_EUMVA|nr:hypothetical protein EVAR_4145_1 [Eumeta japonica]
MVRFPWPRRLLPARPSRLRAAAEPEVRGVSRSPGGCVGLLATVAPVLPDAPPARTPAAGLYLHAGSVIQGGVVQWSTILLQLEPLEPIEALLL